MKSEIRTQLSEKLKVWSRDLPYLNPHPAPSRMKGKSNSCQTAASPPPRPQPFIFPSIDAALWQMTSLISNLSQMMSSFMYQMLAMLSILTSSLKIQTTVAPSN
ncbi:hypothetical protein AVEN_92848-1 [Araneus ventricosus]|uniref:Uncharacterized protein n=1 Tax=Araneus ventricosus TaxID=182803 RepID=A0A4Y2NAD1_ARAVE|nr:hypothetical protein AVEN_92848-1 [Araneus ventricosus]